MLDCVIINPVVPRPQNAYNAGMNSFFKWILRILWWLTFVIIAAVVLVLANREWIVRDLVQKEIRKVTGMNAEIGGVSFSVLEPKMTLNNFRLFNSADFGGTLFVDAPEVHVEFDSDALKKHQLHITLMRVNIGELDLVKNGNATNWFSIVQTVAPAKTVGGHREFSAFDGYAFAGIDLLNVSLGSIKFVDLKNQVNNHSLPVGVKNKIIKNVKAPADLNDFGSQLWSEGASWVGLPVSRPTRETISGTNAVTTPKP